MAFLTTVVARTVSGMKKSGKRRIFCIMPCIHILGENGAAKIRAGLVEEEEEDEEGGILKDKGRESAQVRGICCTYLIGSVHQLKEE